MDKDQLISNITKLAKKNETTVNKALIESGAGKNLIANLKKESIPSVESILKLAEYFNVSVDYLLGKDKLDLPLDEKDILNNYRKLNLDGQEYIRQQIKFALSQDKYID